MTAREHYIRRFARPMLAALALTAALLLPATPADALIHQGHVFGSSFGEAGSGPGQLSDPTGVGIDEATGDLYVVNAGSESVEIFAPEAHGSYQFASEFKVHSPGAIAVDNSSSSGDASPGDVYVIGAPEKEASAEERDEVYEYSPAAGKVIHRYTHFKAKIDGEEEELELEDVSGVSVSQNGVLWVYWAEEGLIDAFAKEATPSAAPKLTWQPSQHRETEVESRFECVARPAFAVAPDDSAFYAGYEHRGPSVSDNCPGEEAEAPDPTVLAKLDAAAPIPAVQSAEVDHQNTTGVAVDSSGDAYLDNGSSIAAFNTEGLLIQRFGTSQLSSASGLALDGASGEVLVAEPKENKIEIFVPDEEVAPPAIDGLSEQNRSPHSAELRAQIDPSGAQTEYHFLYGTVDCVQDPSACTALPVPPGEIPAGFGDQEVSVEVTGLTPATAYFYTLTATNSHGSVEQQPSPNSFTTLPSPSVLPDNRAWEMVTPPEKHGAALISVARFTGGSIQAAVDGDSIAWLSSGPVLAEVQGSRSFEPAQQLSTRGATSWSTESLETPHEQGRGLLLPSPSEYHYFSPDLSLSLLEPTEPTRQVGGVVEHPPLSAEASEKTIYLRHDPPAAPEFQPLVTAANDTAATQFGGALEFLGASSDLSHVIFESKVGLTASAPAAAGLYEWAAGSPLKLTSVLPDGSPAPDQSTGAVPEEPTLGDGGGLNERGAISSDGSRVIFSEERGFVAEALYLSDSETGQSIKLNAAQGNAATEPSSGGQSIEEPGEGRQEVHFQSASSDGSKILFTDTARLSEESSQQASGEESPADLYEFELTSAPGQPMRGRLTDLTPDATAGSADVLNLIPGQSQDGSIAYFVANGVLAQGAAPGQCPRNPEGSEAPPPGASCNLYLSEPDPQHPGALQTRFIAKLSAEDAADWGAGVGGDLPASQDLAALSASVSANGRYLAFMSDQTLTGYDNRDASSGAADEEVYLYDAATARLTCASCNPNADGGAEGEETAFKAPQGVFDTRLGGEGFGLLVDRPKIWQERWLAGSIPSPNFNITNGQPSALYQPRYLSNSGRLFFDSADALVPADTNAKEDVYQYEPDGLGSCADSGGCIGLISSGTSGSESAFIDASENGNDVFFQTAAALVPGDQDSSFDIYDARVCSESSPCLKSSSSSIQECESASSCRAPGSGAPQSPAVPSSTLSSAPSVSSAHQVLGAITPKPPAKKLTRKQQLAKALKACRKDRKKHKRVLCEAQAKKRYGPTKKKPAKKKAAAKKSATDGR